MVRSTYSDRNGVVHQRLKCVIDGCARWRRLYRCWRSDGTTYFLQYRTCNKHRVDGTIYRSQSEDGIREMHWKQMGIEFSIEDYDKMFDKQRGKCCLCGRHQSDFDRRLDVDHCHTTGKIRGLLCRRCNTNIGWIEQHNLLNPIGEYLKTPGGK